MINTILGQGHASILDSGYLGIQHPGPYLQAKWVLLSLVGSTNNTRPAEPVFLGLPLTMARADGPVANVTVSMGEGGAPLLPRLPGGPQRARPFASAV